MFCFTSIRFGVKFAGRAVVLMREVVDVWQSVPGQRTGAHAFTNVLSCATEVTSSGKLTYPKLRAPTVTEVTPSFGRRDRYPGD